MRPGVNSNKETSVRDNESLSLFLIIFGLHIFPVAFFMLLTHLVLGLLGDLNAIYSVALFLFLLFFGIFLIIFPNRYKVRHLLGSGLAFAIFLLMLLLSITFVPSMKLLSFYPEEFDLYIDEETRNKSGPNHDNVIFYEWLIYGIMILSFLVGLVLLIVYLKNYLKNNKDREFTAVQVEV